MTNKKHNVILLLIGIFVYSLLCCYVGQNIASAVFSITTHSITIAVVVYYIAFCMCFVLSFLKIRNGFGRIVRRIGMVWLGIWIYLFMFFALFDFCGALWNLFFNSEFNSNLFYKISIVASIWFGIYGYIHNEKLKTVNYKMRFTNGQGGLKIAYMSDLHIGSVNSERQLSDIIKKINKQGADIVCLVGDIFDGDFYLIERPSYVSKLLSNIQSKYGVFACLGNHDAGDTYDKMVAMLRNCNINVLKEQYVVIDNRYVLVGRLDENPIGGYKKGAKRNGLDMIMNDARKHELPIIVMDHTPPKYTCIQAVQHYYGDVLLLCGHTHKGQIWPFGYITKKMFVKDYGYLRAQDFNPHIIVSSGAGTWGMPMRIGTTREVVCVDVDFQQPTTYEIFESR